MKDISVSIPKVDNLEKTSGSALYVNDYDMEGMLYAKTLRSTISKGKIKEIEIPYLPFGYEIVDYKDVPGQNIVKVIFDDMPVFAKNEVTYKGEPILLIVGEDKVVIDEILKQIKVIYIEETPTYEWKNSCCHYHFTKGNPISVFNMASRVITYDYETGYQEQAYIEPQGFLGYPEGKKITLIGSIQCPYYVKNAVIMALGVPFDEVRIIQASVGGAFGGKEEFPSLIGCQLAVAVAKIQKPIKLIYEREEDMISSTKRHPSKITMSAAINDKKELIGIKAKVGIDAGATIGLSGVVLSRALIASTGAYTIPNLEVNGDVYLTNTVPNGAFRGFGAPQMLFAIEMFMEHIAKDLSEDPFLYRLKYLAKQGDPTSTNGLFRDPIIMKQMIEKAMVVSDYSKKIKEFSTDNSFRGIGMSWFLHGCGFTGSGESTHIHAKVKLRKDKQNKVHILIAAVDMGQGVKTTMRKVVSDILNLPIDQVIYNNPDTDFVPDSGPTVASRTMMIVGGLVARCALQLKEKWIDLEEIICEENYSQPDYIKWDESTFTGDAYPAYSWGVNVVEVKVNKATYMTDIAGVWSVYDLGKAIDERIVLGQADGGIAQGIAYGYLEVMEVKNGKIMQKNFTDYMIPTASDVGQMETYIMDNPYPLGPYGAKGVGELTLVGGAPAVAKAIENAINRKVLKIPATPELIMELIENGKH
ncbi:MAG: xanthine dehydrogenase family protein molybdopterin-binding subunit [Firmicutes bacterium]|nr:xanthine dehydrogenase family protein molybdopterin-binding subunit [Bacillota bacterium]